MKSALKDTLKNKIYVNKTQKASTIAYNMKIKQNALYVNKTIIYKIIYALKYRVKFKDAIYTNPNKSV